MIRSDICTATAVVFLGVLSAAQPSLAAASDYRFELAGTPRADGTQDVVQIRILQIATGKPVTGAVIFESTADMGPAGMANMPAPIKALPVQGDIYSFAVEPGMAGTWALHFAAKLQGEPQTLRGTVNANLVK